MRFCTKLSVLLAIFLMAACNTTTPRTYEVINGKTIYSALPCQKNDEGTLSKTYLWSEQQHKEVCSIYNQPTVGADGVRTCPNNRICSDEAMLPYQPCAQPMPTYYSNVSATQTAEGVLLQHPITRTMILCYELPNQSAETCVNNFKAVGYVLITDIPQVTANYDLLQENTYPSRRYRHGEHNPRW